MSTADVEHEFPLGEVTFYDKFCDRMVVNYRIYPDGSVQRMPGFLNGHNLDVSQWETKGEGEIVELVPPPEQDWPGPLEEVETDGLAAMMFDLLGVIKPIGQARVQLSCTPPGTMVNDSMYIDSYERESRQPGVETAVKYKVLVIEHLAPRITDNHQFIVYENGSSEYKYQQVDFGPTVSIAELLENGGIQPAGAGFTMEDLQERFDRRDAYLRWEKEIRDAGLHCANEEQAQTVAAVLQDMMPRVK